MATTKKLALTKVQVEKGLNPKWRKKYKGQIFYFRGSYQQALALWTEKRRQLDGGNPAELKPCLQLDKQLRTVGGLPSRVVDSLLEILPPTPAKKPAPRIKTIGEAMADFLACRESAVMMGTIRASTHSTSEKSITYFRKWAGDSTPLAEINEEMLARFFNHLAGEIQAERITRGYACNVLGYAKQFIREQWELHRLDLPRNIKSRSLTIRNQAKEVPVLSLETIRRFYDASRPLLRCCILLSLNCGFTEKDISDLHHNEVDLETGRITRKRSKTSDHPNVPMVCWKLWPSTLEALKREAVRSNHPEMVLLSTSGLPLVRGCGLERHDSIFFSWRRVRITLGLTDSPYKLLRKTSATMLGSHANYGRYAHYFLGHKANNVADAHYVRPSQVQFDEAVAWLGEQYGILE
jgi:hypothetical protein